MRHLPASTRIAIATLYIRYRDSRRLADRARTDMGIGSLAANNARATELAEWNALQAVLANVHAERSKVGTHEFVRLVGRRAAAFARKAARAA